MKLLMIVELVEQIRAGKHDDIRSFLVIWTGFAFCTWNRVHT